ncbi:MAG TPA: hypothetical protein VFQ61_34750 [Polyangiaceae bacterium]|nr:hypothetical protein [Polyangiaceae bacterium]
MQELGRSLGFSAGYRVAFAGRLIALTSVTLGVLATTSKASAQLELSARTGYGHGFGKLSNAPTGGNLRDVTSGQLPIWFDAGFRVTPSVAILGFFSYGWGFSGDYADDICKSADLSGITCDTWSTDMRVGAQVHYHLAPNKKSPGPWFGLGVGYEVLRFGLDLVEFRSVEQKGSGLEFFNVQFGVDIPGNGAIAGGPFLALSVGQYSSGTLSCSGRGCEDTSTITLDIDKKAPHAWLFLGVRLRLQPTELRPPAPKRREYEPPNE